MGDNKIASRIFGRHLKIEDESENEEVVFEELKEDDSKSKIPIIKPDVPQNQRNSFDGGEYDDNSHLDDLFHEYVGTEPEEDWVSVQSSSENETETQEQNMFEEIDLNENSKDEDSIELQEVKVAEKRDIETESNEITTEGGIEMQDEEKEKIGEGQVENEEGETLVLNFQAPVITEDDHEAILDKRIINDEEDHSHLDDIFAAHVEEAENVPDTGDFSIDGFDEKDEVIHANEFEVLDKNDAGYFINPEENEIENVSDSGNSENVTESRDLDISFEVDEKEDQLQNQEDNIDFEVSMDEEKQEVKPEEEEIDFEVSFDDEQSEIERNEEESEKQEEETVEQFGIEEKEQADREDNFEIEDNHTDTIVKEQEIEEPSFEVQKEAEEDQVVEEQVDQNSEEQVEEEIPQQEEAPAEIAEEADVETQAALEEAIVEEKPKKQSYIREIGKAEDLLAELAMKYIKIQTMSNDIHNFLVKNIEVIKKERLVICLEEADVTLEEYRDFFISETPGYKKEGVYNKLRQIEMQYLFEEFIHYFDYDQFERVMYTVDGKEVKNVVNFENKISVDVYHSPQTASKTEINQGEGAFILTHKLEINFDEYLEEVRNARLNCENVYLVVMDGVVLDEETISKAKKYGVKIVDMDMSISTINRNLEEIKKGIE